MGDLVKDVQLSIWQDLNSGRGVGGFAAISLWCCVQHHPLEVAQELDDFSVLVRWYHTFDFFLRLVAFFVNLFQVKRQKSFIHLGGSMLNRKYWKTSYLGYSHRQLKQGQRVWSKIEITSVICLLSKGKCQDSLSGWECFSLALFSVHFDNAIGNTSLWDVVEMRRYQKQHLRHPK